MDSGSSSPPVAVIYSVASASPALVRRVLRTAVPDDVAVGITPAQRLGKVRTEQSGGRAGLPARASRVSMQSPSQGQLDTEAA